MFIPYFCKNKYYTISKRNYLDDYSHVKSQKIDMTLSGRYLSKYPFATLNFNQFDKYPNVEQSSHLIQIIRTTYMRNQKRIEHNKKTSDKDSRYFELAETYLYYEIATVMGMSFEEAKEYVFQKVHNEIS